MRQWLDKGEQQILRKVIRAKIATAKVKIVEEQVKAVADAQYLADAAEAAREVVFYERVLTLLGTIQLGHNPEKPNEAFEYSEIVVITDQEPITT